MRILQENFYACCLNYILPGNFLPWAHAGQILYPETLSFSPFPCLCTSSGNCLPQGHESKSGCVWSTLPQQLGCLWKQRLFLRDFTQREAVMLDNPINLRQGIMCRYFTETKQGESNHRIQLRENAPIIVQNGGGWEAFQSYHCKGEKCFGF